MEKAEARFPHRSYRDPGVLAKRTKKVQVFRERLVKRKEARTKKALEKAQENNKVVSIAPPVFADLAEELNAGIPEDN